MKKEKELVTKGYKVTNSDMKCNGYKYELGKEHTQSGELVICNNGFHFCEKLSHCFNYYTFDRKNRVFEIEAYGEIVTNGDKSCTSHIVLIRELTWEEVLKLANEGLDNTGHSNTGYSNTGDRNTGDRNTGYSNTGYSNTGDRNTGDRNTGGWNTGDRNTGYRNTGGWNTGDRNTGGWNTGDRNTGYSNTGDRNTGYRNTGGWNTGDRNTGYSNTGDRNTGVFCTGDADFPMFNKPSKWTEKQFLESRAFYLLQTRIDTKLWINHTIMTEQEKKDNRGWERAEGYYRDIPYKEAFTNAWHNFTNSDKEAFTSLPNFDAKIFEEITGVKI